MWLPFLIPWSDGVFTPKCPLLGYNGATLCVTNADVTQLEVPFKCLQETASAH